MSINDSWISVNDRYPTNNGKYKVQSTGILNGCRDCGCGIYDNAVFVQDMRNDEEMKMLYNESKLLNVFYIYGRAGGRYILNVTHWQNDINS